MSRMSVSDALLMQVWRHAVACLRKTVRLKEHNPTLLSAWAVSTLLSVGISTNDPEIRSHLITLDRWVEQLKENAGILNESQAGLLGLWISICVQRRQHLDEDLRNLFLNAVEHNLQKRKELSLASSIDLLTAIATGLGSISGSDQLRSQVAQQMQTLSQTTDAIDLVQIIQSLALIRRENTIPRLDVQYRLESIRADDDSSVIERAMASYGQLRLAQIFGTLPKLEWEMRLLECLNLLNNSDQADDVIKVYLLSLPHLQKSVSYSSLYDAWKVYLDSTLKRAKTENYLFRYFSFLMVVVLLAAAAWPWFHQLEVKQWLPIATTLITVVLTVTAIIVRTIAELYGRQLWEQKRLETMIVLIGVLVSFAFAVVGALV